MKKSKARNFKFWYEIHSGNQMATDVMNEEEALQWLRGNQQNIVAIQVIENMTKVEAMSYVRRNVDYDE